MAMKEAAANRLKGLRQTSCGLIAEYRSVRFPSSKNCPEQRDKRKGHSRDSCRGSSLKLVPPSVTPACRSNPTLGDPNASTRQSRIPITPLYPPYPLVLLILP